MSIKLLVWNNTEDAAKIIILINISVLTNEGSCPYTYLLYKVIIIKIIKCRQTDDIFTNQYMPECNNNPTTLTQK